MVRVLLVVIWLFVIVALPVLPDGYDKYDYSDARIRDSNDPYIEEEGSPTEPYEYEGEVYETGPYEPEFNGQCLGLPNGQRVCYEEEGEVLRGKPTGWAEMGCQLEESTGMEYCYYQGTTLNCVRNEGLLDCTL